MHALKHARVLQNFTQMELQFHSKVSQCRISMAENGWITLSEDEKSRIERALNRVGRVDWDKPSLLRRKRQDISSKIGAHNEA